MFFSESPNLMGFLIKSSQMLQQNCGHIKLISLTFGNKVRKIFSHYEFFVYLVAPDFKQRHILRYDDITIQNITTEQPTWNRREQWPLNAAHVLNQILRNPFVSDRWRTFWQECQMPHRAGLILGQIPHCTELKGAVSRNSAKLGNYKMPVKLRET